MGDGYTKSPVRDMDPTVRALNTILYGVIVHYGTMLAVRQETDETESCQTLQPHWFAATLLLHEYWIYLQHSNVLGNPLCQRLDRQYGIALLRSNQHWSIAGTLSAYWCREMISLFLCLPFLSNFTQYVVLYSLIYHTIKSIGIRKDAIERYSPPLGIMRQVIDKFYHHSATESLVTVVRLLLQGMDTLIHALVVKDLIASGHIGLETVTFLDTLFVIWVVHAALNQFFLCSTATIMVQTWNALSMKSQPPSGEDTDVSMCDTSDDETDSDGDNTSTDDETEDENEKFIVRSLLRPGRVSDNLKGKQGAASSGVDTAIRIETLLAINASVYIFGFADVPMRILLLPSENFQEIDPKQLLMTTLPYAWLLFFSLSALQQLFSPRTNVAPQRKVGESVNTSRRRFLFNAIDVFMVVIGSYWSDSSLETKFIAHVLGAAITAKSFLKASKWHAPKIFWQVMGVLEFAMRIVVGRRLIPRKQEDAALIGAGATILSAIYTLLQSPNVDSQYTPTRKQSVADVAFLGHPAELHDCWALWLLPYSLESRWQRPWWVVPLWPLHYAIGYYTCHWRPKLFGDGASFFGCDDVLYGSIRMQTWTSCHFGRHFFTAKGAVKRNIEATARHAERIGLKVLTLGALNKAEGINRGGASVALALGPERKLSIIHGNHLTAAAVVETTRQCFGEKARVFLTGASSKVGWAVAQALKDRFDYDVLCHSTDGARREIFRQKGFCAASTLKEGMSFTNLWIVGKYDQVVADTIPQGSTAIVFAVPHPLHGRKDVRVIEAGNLHVDLSRLDRPRRFTNKLASHEIFACHAAGIVAANRLKNGKAGPNGRIDEIGPVDPKTMDSWLEDAKKLGFSVPLVEPADATSAYDLSQQTTAGSLPVVIVGAGPSGLAVAALLRMKGIRSILLEEQTEQDSYGSWDNHFTQLEVTTSKKLCNLPGYSMNNRDFPGEHVTATQYRKYLRMYAERFQLDIRRGHRVKDIGRGDETAAWTLHCVEPMGSFRTSAVVVATGKHRIPRRDTDDGLLDRLQSSGIETVHSTDMRDPQIWNRATTAAEKGKLCVVGFGNSAADIATSILRQAKKGGKDKCIHISARTVPPVFPRSKSFLRVDSIGSYVRLLPNAIQEVVTRLLWRVVPDSAECNAAFPSHLPRWKTVAGRVPVIDKSGAITGGLRAGSLVGHGPITEVVAVENTPGDDTTNTTSTNNSAGTTLTSAPSIRFDDGSSDSPCSEEDKPVPIEFVIMATGYKKHCIVTREDRLNGMFLCGFGNDFLPIRSISEEARAIATEIESTCSGGAR